MKSTRTKKIALLAFAMLIFFSGCGSKTATTQVPNLVDTIVSYNYEENGVIFETTHSVEIESSDFGRYERYLIETEGKYYLTDSIYVRSGITADIVSEDFKSVSTVLGVNEDSFPEAKMPDSTRELNWTELKKVQEVGEKVLVSGLYDEDTQVFSDEEGDYYICDESSIFEIDEETYINPERSLNPLKVESVSLMKDVYQAYTGELISSGYWEITLSNGKIITQDDIPEELETAIETEKIVFIV